MTKVLVVDDEGPVHSAVKRMLGVHGFDVTMASSYEEALQLLRKAPYEVLLTDLRMNGPDGLELIRATHASSPATRPILMIFGAVHRHSSPATCGVRAVLLDENSVMRRVEGLDRRSRGVKVMAMSHVLRDESLGGWVDDELGLILNPQGRDRVGVRTDPFGDDPLAAPRATSAGRPRRVLIRLACPFESLDDPAG